MKKYLLRLLFLLTFLVSGCSSPAATTSAPPVVSTIQQNLTHSQPTVPALRMLNRDQLASYAATFEVSFEGATPWKYQLKTRKSPTLRETNLHIEGINGAQNPGDVRMVTNGTTSWMIGPGTDQECVQFPNNQGMDPTLIYPETLFGSQDLPALMKLVGEEKVAGAASLHYQARAVAINGWENAQVDIWQEKNSKTLIQFTMQATGEDPFFSSGTGKLSARYDVSGMGSAPIEAVKGCEIDVPLPDSATKIVRLPGIASFESSQSREEIQSFYQSRLPQENWVEKNALAQTAEAVVISYQRDAESVEIRIADAPSQGTQVKLLFMPEQ